MPRRYICRDCKRVERRSKSCDFCGKKMEALEYDPTKSTYLPYIFAGIAALILLMSFLLDIVLLIWFTFPLIILGLILDYIYQKDLDNKAEYEIKKGL